MTAIIEVFTTPNLKTKSGKPRLWRWRISDDQWSSPLVAKGPGSFSTPQKCFIDIAKHAVVPQGALLRVEGKDDVPWVMS